MLQSQFGVSLKRHHLRRDRWSRCRAGLRRRILPRMPMRRTRRNASRILIWISQVRTRSRLDLWTIRVL